jgi:hypothetical protein
MFVSRLEELKSSFIEIFAKMEQADHLHMEEAKKQSNSQFQTILAEFYEKEIEILVPANKEFIAYYAGFI